MHADGSVQTQRLQLTRAKVTQAKLSSCDALTRQQRQWPCQGFYQAGFTRTIGAEQTNAGIRQYAEADIVQHGRLSVTNVRLSQVDQWARHLAGWKKAKLKGRINMRRHNRFHALQSFEPALSLARLGGLGAKTIHIRLHVRNTLLLFLIGGLLLRQLLRTLAFVGRVVSRITVELMVFDGDHPLHHRVEKIPVVRNDDQSSRVALQPLL